MSNNRVSLSDSTIITIIITIITVIINNAIILTRISEYQNIQQNGYLPTAETGYVATAEIGDLPTAGSSILEWTSERKTHFIVIVNRASGDLDSLKSNPLVLRANAQIAQPELSSSSCACSDM